MPLFKTLLLPMEPRILNMQKGWMMDGEFLPEKDQKRVTRKKMEPCVIDEENPWFKGLKLSLRIALFILFLPVFILAHIIDLATKGKSEMSDIFELYFDRLFCFFLPKSKRCYSEIKRLKYQDAVWEDIASFFDITFERQYIIIIYSTRWPNRDEVIKLKHLKSKGFIGNFYVVKPPMGLLELTQQIYINRLNSKFILREADGFHVSSKDGFDLEVKAPDHTNVFLLRNQYDNVPKYRVFTSFSDFCRFTSPYFLSRKEENISPDYLFYIGRNEETILDTYIKAHHDELVERYKEKGFIFSYYPIAKNRQDYFSDLELKFLKYKMPRLYNLPDETIREFLSVLQLELSATDFYSHFVQNLELPHFSKPALVRLLFRTGNDYPKKYSVYPFYKNGSQNPKEWFDYHIVRIKKYEPNNHIYFSISPEPEKYDADSSFQSEQTKLSEEFKTFIDRIKPDQHGVMAEAMIFMLQKLKSENPEILQKLKPIIHSQNLLEPPTQLSPVLVNEQYKIILPEFGNQEVVMHPLPRTVYIFFLRYPAGIRFKELFQYKQELLGIYNKITNQYDNEKIEQAINDLVDMSNPSINQKCARIREAFRKIMDEPIARHYYIDGPNGEPKRISLPARLVDIRF